MGVSWMKTTSLEELVAVERELKEAKKAAERAADRVTALGEKRERLLAGGEFPVGANVSERYVKLADGTVVEVKHIHNATSGMPKVTFRVIEIEEPRKE